MNRDRDRHTLRATFARHASEFIGGFIVAVAVTLLLGAAFAIIVGFNAPPAADVPDLLPDVVTPPAAVDPSERFGWSAHALFVVLGAVGLGQFVWGNGVRPNSLTPNHPSIYFTLSLPVSRTALVMSRYLFAAGGSALLMVLMLLINVTTLWLFGHAVPLAEMMVVSSLGFLFLCAVTAAYGSLGVISDNLAAGLLVIGILAVMAFAWTPVFGLVAVSPLFSATPVALLAITAALLVTTVILAKRRDF